MRVKLRWKPKLADGIYRRSASVRLGLFFFKLRKKCDQTRFWFVGATIWGKKINWVQQCAHILQNYHEASALRWMLLSNILLFFICLSFQVSVVLLIGWQQRLTVKCGWGTNRSKQQRVVWVSNGYTIVWEP